MYDVNQNKLIFTFQKIYIHQSNQMCIHPPQIHIHVHLQERKDKFILAGIIRFLVLEIYLTSLLLLGRIHIDLKLKYTHYF